MDFSTVINLQSKTFWLGLFMVFAGLYKAVGVDIPVIPDLEVLNSLAPEDSATLMKMGFAMIFVRDAISKVSK